MVLVVDELTGFDLSTSSDSSVSLPSAFHVSVLLCITQEKTHPECALLWGNLRVSSQSLEWLHTAAVLLVTQFIRSPTASRALNLLVSEPGNFSQRTPDLLI